MNNELAWRLGCFFTILVLMMLLEWRKPARRSSIKATQRWGANFALVFVSSVLARLTLPIGLTALALFNQQHAIGLFNLVALPYWLVVVISFLLLDLIIYWQHRLFHQIPVLWRLHRVHHADAHVDTSTGLRFHPLEIIMSIAVKAVAISVLGIPPLGVLIFEVALNGLALFNHANIRLPLIVEKPLRLFIMTQTLHRIHHSQTVSETNSNYGFSLIWWDKLFASYKACAKLSDEELKIGLKEYPQPEINARFMALLLMPFKK